MKDELTIYKEPGIRLRRESTKRRVDDEVDGAYNGRNNGEPFPHHYKTLDFSHGFEGFARDKTRTFIHLSRLRNVCE